MGKVFCVKGCKRNILKSPVGALCCQDMSFLGTAEIPPHTGTLSGSIKVASEAMGCVVFSLSVWKIPPTVGREAA